MPPLLLYDGTCAFCARNVRFVLAHEGASRSLRFARLEGPHGRHVLEARPDLAETVVWYEPAAEGRAARTLVRSAATVAVLRYLGGVWALLGGLLDLVPRVVRDAGYDVIARHRHRIAGRDVCVIPTPDQRARFLDPPQ